MPTRTTYCFADLTLDTGLRRLERAGEPIDLGKLTYELLVALVENAPSVISHDELVQRVWAGRLTSPETVTQRIKLLRDALGDDAEKPRYIGLVRGQGYRLIPRVASRALSESAAAEGSAVVATPAARGASRFARATIAAALILVVLATGSLLYMNADRARDSAPEITEQSPLPNSVAVLPFENLSPDPAHGYFAAGIQEMLLSELTAIKSLNVIARSSVQRYADGRTPLAQVAAELHVETLLRATVQYSGDRVRITAALVEPETESQLWAESYDRDFDDVFAIQSDIATAIALALEAELDPAERRALETPPSRSSAAYALYLEALRDAGRRRLPLEDDRERLPFLDRAIALDPNFAEPYLAKANIYVWAVAYSELGSSPDEIARRAEYERLALENAARAAELDPRLPGPWLVRGVLHLESWRWDDAEAAFTRALELGPNSPDVLLEVAYLRAYSGEYDRALQLARRRLELDPNSVDSNNAVAFAALLSGDHQTAVEHYREVVRLAPGLWFWYAFLAAAQIGAGDRAGAEESLRTAEELRGADDTAIFMSAMATHYRRLGRNDDANRAFAEFEAWAGNYVVSAGDWAVAYQGIGDYDKMHEWLERAVQKAEAHEPDSHQALIHVVANYGRDPVLEEPRFRELRAKLVPPRSRAALAPSGGGSTR